MKDFGNTYYRWNPPEFTDAELSVVKEKDSRRLNEIAKRDGLSPEWVRALGGIPEMESK